MGKVLLDWRSDGTRAKLYRCAGQVGQSGGIRRERTGCTAASVPLDDLEAAVLGQVEGLRLDPDALSGVADCNAPVADERAAVETELSALAALSGVADCNAPVADERAAVETELSALAAKLERLARLYVDGGLPWEALGDVRELPHETQHALLRQLIDAVDVHPGRLVIRWRFA